MAEITSTKKTIETKSKQKWVVIEPGWILPANPNKKQQQEIMNEIQEICANLRGKQNAKERWKEIQKQIRK